MPNRKSRPGDAPELLLFEATARRPPQAGRQLAAKRLVAVEVDRTASHQRELNAGRLRNQLGFNELETRGSLHVLNYRESASPTERSGPYVVYDARKGKPPRREFRLYFSPDLIRAAAGDLLIVFRIGEDNDLGAVVAKAGTDLEQRLLQALDLGDEQALHRLVFRDAQVPNRQQAAGLINKIVGTAQSHQGEYDIANHPLLLEAINKNALPATAVMAAAASELVNKKFGAKLDPDARLEALLDAETALFTAMQLSIGNAALKKMADHGEMNLVEVAAFVMKLQQAAKSRRGYSLQNHFELLLKENGVPYKAQATTERDEKPDFLIPGEAEYRDLSYPAARLRMVAAKSRVRERWRDVIEQADRIPEKYFLTVDENMAEDKIRKMRSKHLRVFMPRQLIEARYGSQQGMLEDVTTLLRELRAAGGK